MGVISSIFSKEDSCRLLVNLDGRIATKYKWYRQFLVHNHEALNIMSEMELLQEGAEPFTLTAVEHRYDRLLAATQQLVDALNHLSGGRYQELVRICHTIDEQTRPLFAAAHPHRSDHLVLPLDAVSPDMTSLVGSKAANLAAMGNQLGLPVPSGFVVTANAFWLFLDQTGLSGPIEEMLSSLSAEAPEAMEEMTARIQEEILRAEVPAALQDGIFEAYEALEEKTAKGISIAMRSTAVGEDTEASFAGQYSTVLNVGRKELLNAYKTVVASKYTPRAILYRMRCGLDDRATPMSVAGIEMIRAKASGVVYTADPSEPASSQLLVTATWGLGEYLVSGAATPDTYYVDRQSLRLSKKEINRKAQRIVALEDGGTRLEETPQHDQEAPAIDDETVQVLARHGMTLERHFAAPQDMEWCVDQGQQLFILQSRPLGLVQSRPHDKAQRKDYPGHTVLLSTGSRASGGTVVGQVFPATALKAEALPNDSILVAKTASPDYARYVHKVKGIITDVGSVASHLASVAREFGVPMIVNAGDATQKLQEGKTVTMVADSSTVYEGRVAELVESVLLPKDEIFQSPVRRKLDAIMEKISPLNLTDPQAPTFRPDACRTVHDVIRYAHENVVAEMFGLSEHKADSIRSVRMTANIPLALHFIDLGGGLKGNLTTCDVITPDAIASPPMRALWRGLSHPGITWSGAVNLSTQNVMALMTSGPPPQMASYVVISDEYVNLSVKFGYHYANIDILCNSVPENNYIALQFGGGAGSYYGRSMRISFLAEVLQELGFTLDISGDLLEASVKGLGVQAMEETIDQLGRLLASSRLLDLAIPNQAEVGQMVRSFFNGDYNFLNQEPSPLPSFYTPIGDWSLEQENGRSVFLQDGSKSGEGFSCTIKTVMGKMVGNKYQQFLDGLQAYHYFPMAILKESHVTDASLQVTLRLESGCLDRTGGLAFAIRNVGNYFVLSLDALRNRITLFEFVNNRRFQRDMVEKAIDSEKRYVLSVRVAASRCTGFVDGEAVTDFEAERPLDGYVGLWTKSDSKVYFEELTIQAGGKKRVAAFQ